MTMNSLRKGLSAFYETFDKDVHLNRPGTGGIKAAIGIFEIFKTFVNYQE